MIDYLMGILETLQPYKWYWLIQCGILFAVGAHLNDFFKENKILSTIITIISFIIFEFMCLVAIFLFAPITKASTIGFLITFSLLTISLILIASLLKRHQLIDGK